MRRLALVAVCLLVVSGVCRAEEMKKLKVGGITITYPRDLEKQAKEVGKVAGEVLPPKFKEHRELSKKLSDTKKIAERIATLLGCPEYERNAESMYSRFVEFSADFPLRYFSDIRLYHEAAIKPTGRLAVDGVEIWYDAREDTYRTYLQVASDDKPGTVRPHWPIVVGGDGGFRTRKPLGEQIAEDFDNQSMMELASIHEAAESVIMQELKMYHPFTRWFNDGAASWVMVKIAGEVRPGMATRISDAFLPNDESKALRGKINLYAWPQGMYDTEHETPEDRRYDGAGYTFALELITRLMDGQPEGALGAVIYKLKSGDPAPDTERICRAVKEVMGKDCKAMLMEYVPESVRKDMQAGRVKELKDDAWYYFAGPKDLKKSVESLEKALEIEPNDPDGHFNLAFLMRKVGGMEDESVRHAKIAAGLIAGKRTHQFRHYDPDDPESLYLMGRMNQFAGSIEMAETIFRMILEKYPDHADSKHALEEMGK